MKLALEKPVLVPGCRLNSQSAFGVCGSYGAALRADVGKLFSNERMGLLVREEAGQWARSLRWQHPKMEAEGGPETGGGQNE